MADLLSGLLSSDMAIDLGTSTTMVYVRDRGIVLSEPSIVVLERATRRICAIGEEAKSLVGRAPPALSVVKPMKDGVIADFEATQAMIRHFIRKAQGRRSLRRPRIVVTIPSSITEVERRAVRESAEQAGAREVHLIEEVLAAAIGAGLPIADARGNLIVDIGGGTTEAAVLSLGGIVVTRSVAAAGDEMDEALMTHFRRRFNLVIGEVTAEEVKIRIGSISPMGEEASLEVRGRDQASGLPRMVRVGSEDVRPILLEPARLIIGTIKETLEDTPPQLSADLIDRGMVLAGGGSLLRGWPDILREETLMPVSLADDPLGCVAAGAGRFLEELDRLHGGGGPIERRLLADRRP